MGRSMRPSAPRRSSQQREVVMRGLPMTGYFGVREQVDKDFHGALLKASLRRWKARLRGNNRHERLLSFEEVKRAWVRWSQSYRGMRTVEIERIVGSVGRWRDF